MNAPVFCVYCFNRVFVADGFDDFFAGNKFEKMMIETLREFSNIIPLYEWPNQLQNLFEDATLRIPSNSLRGGTTEIMKGIIARQLGLR